MMYIKKMGLLIEKYRKIFIFLICSIFIFLIGYMNGPSIEKYYYDSTYYYQLSQSFFANGSFKFTNYILSFRGYLFPFILYIYTVIGNIFSLDHSISILIANSMFVSFLFTIVLPEFFPNSIKKPAIIKIFIPIILFMIYWKDLVYYPLSDLYSYGAIIIAMWVLKCVNFNNTIKYFLQGILFGILLYAAYNIRTIYLFTIPIVILIYIIFNRKENIRKILLFFATTAIGLLICSLPQICINEQYYNDKTIFVITDSFGESGLFNYQLFTGLSLQRYETYVGDLNVYPSPGLAFIDGVGSLLMQSEQMTTSSSISDYIKIGINHPLDFIGIITRHFLNIFHLPYNQVYIKDMNYHKTFFTIFNYTILFIGGIGLIKIYIKRKTIKFDKNILYLLVTLIPCLAILPGAIEMRFFMPMYVLLYCFITYRISFYDLLITVRHNKFKVLISYIFILAILSAVWGSTFNSAQLVPQLLN